MINIYFYIIDMIKIGVKSYNLFTDSSNMGLAFTCDISREELKVDHRGGV